MQTAIDYRKRITEELDAIPDTELPGLAQIVHVYREARSRSVLDCAMPDQQAAIKGKLAEANEDIEQGRVSPLDMQSIIREAKAEFNQDK